MDLLEHDIQIRQKEYRREVEFKRDDPQELYEGANQKFELGAAWNGLKEFVPVAQFL